MYRSSLVYLSKHQGHILMSVNVWQNASYKSLCAARQKQVLPEVLKEVISIRNNIYPKQALPCT